MRGLALWVVFLCGAFVSGASPLGPVRKPPRYYPMSTNLIDAVTIPKIELMIGTGSSRVFADAGFDNSCVIVADVLGVSLVGVDGFDVDRINTTLPWCEPWSWYRVEMQVRKVVRGIMPANRFWIPVMLQSDERCLSKREWVFYQGMTLKMLVQELGGRHVIRTFAPVLPYDPYSENAKVFSADDIPRGDSEVYWNEGFSFLSSNNCSTAVLYGDHTLAVFSCEAIRAGWGALHFHDFSAGKVHVWTRKGGCPEYWSTSWFSDHLPNGEERVFVNKLASDESPTVGCAAQNSAEQTEL